MIRLLAPLLAVLVFSPAHAQSFGHGMFGHDQNRHVGDDEEKWQEDADVQPPGWPADANLVRIDVSAAAANDYFIDSASLDIGKDRVVRYTLVVKTTGGATNVSFEGIDCRGPMWKHYASGRSDKTWSKASARRLEWRPIENKTINAHHAALSRYYFCPQGVAIVTADEGRNALRLGKHPTVN